MGSTVGDPFSQVEFELPRAKSGDQVDTPPLGTTPEMESDVNWPSSPRASSLPAPPRWAPPALPTRGPSGDWAADAAEALLARVVDPFGAVEEETNESISPTSISPVGGGVPLSSVCSIILEESGPSTAQHSDQ